jgi:hypothetical protein
MAKRDKSAYSIAMWDQRLEMWVARVQRKFGGGNYVKAGRAAETICSILLSASAA